MAKTRRKKQTRRTKATNRITYREESAQSLAEFLRLTDSIYESWNDAESYFPDPWYRGVTNTSFTLLPGFYRLSKELSYLEEDDYREEFMRRAPMLLDGRMPITHWEWYFLMQHYGLPTRLLDWSEGALIGLFFAVENPAGLQDPVADACVWVLDPWYLNQWSIQSSEILVFHEERAARFLNAGLFEEDDLPKRPVAFMPMYNSRRLAAQRGMFTIHGKDKKPLEAMLPVPEDGQPRLVKIILPKENVAEIRESLRRTGMTDVVLFPELPSLALDMRRSWERPGV